MTEDEVLDQFECYELREEIKILRGKLALAEVRNPHSGKGVETGRNSTVKDAERRAEVAEARYEAALKRNVILARKVKKLGG